MAPDGKLVFIDLAKPGTGLCIPPAKDLYNPGKNAGAMVASNSWGGYYNGAGYYSSQDVDFYLYKRTVRSGDKLWSYSIWLCRSYLHSSLCLLHFCYAPRSS